MAGAHERHIFHPEGPSNSSDRNETRCIRFSSSRRVEWHTVRLCAAKIAESHYWHPTDQYWCVVTGTNCVNFHRRNTPIGAFDASRQDDTSELLHAKIRPETPIFSLPGWLEVQVPKHQHHFWTISQSILVFLRQETYFWNQCEKLVTRCSSFRIIQQNFGKLIFPIF